MPDFDPNKFWTPENYDFEEIDDISPADAARQIPDVMVAPMLQMMDMLNHVEGEPDDPEYGEVIRILQERYDALEADTHPEG